MITLDLPTKTTPRPVGRKRNSATFNGAAFTRLTGGWLGRRQSPTSELRTELAPLRWRSRERERNDPMIARFFKLLEKNVVGSKGMGLRVLGRNKAGEIDRDTNRHIEREFAQWSKRGNCEVSGFFSFVGGQAMTVRTTARDGETFIRHLDGWNNPWGYAFQFLDADQFEESFQGNAPNGAHIVASVERDAWNRPAGYHLWTAHPDDYFEKKERIRLPADQIEHVFRPRRAGAPRGEPWITPVLKGIWDIERATEAVVVNLRVSAGKMGFIEPGDDGDGSDDDEEPRDSSAFEADPGVIDYLNKGDKFVGFSPDFPTGEFIALKESVQHEQAAALDVAHYSLTGDVDGATYSSLRVVLLDERDSYRQLHGWFIDTVLQPIYRRWLRQAVLTGRVKVPNGDITPYLEVRWKPRGWLWIDPQKEVMAKALEKAFVFTTSSRILDEEGEDYETTLEEASADKKLEQEHGITPAVPSIVINVGAPNDDQGDTEGATVGDGKATSANRHRGGRSRPALAAI